MFHFKNYVIKIMYVQHNTENQNTHFMFNNFFQSHAVYEILWKSMVESDTTQMTISHGACALNAG
jgi:hypothetical protein